MGDHLFFRDKSSISMGHFHPFSIATLVITMGPLFGPWDTESRGEVSDSMPKVVSKERLERVFVEATVFWDGIGMDRCILWYFCMGC